jgi:hypothetical protein
MPKRSPPVPAVGSPSLRPEVAIVHLRELKAKLEQGTASGRLSEQEADRLDYAVQATLRDALGENHDDIYRISRAGQLLFGPMDWSEAQWERHRVDRLKQVAELVGDLATHIERKIVTAVASPSVTRPSATDYVERLLLRFHRLARRLRVRRSGRPTLEVNDEYDVQDLLGALLHLHFDDIRSEEWTPSYAGKSSRMDFLLKAEQLVIETKMTRAGLGEKEIGDELLIDIGRYRSHPDCKTLFCFVYDPMGRIGNPDGLERDLSGTKDGLRVKVTVAPRQ